MTPAASGADPPGQMKQLAEFRGSGVLSEDEFSIKKVEILARM